MTQTTTISTLIPALAVRLETKSDTARLDAQNLVAHVVGRNRAWVLGHPEAILEPDQLNWLDQAAGELERGTPLPYLVGAWEFYGLRFEVSPAVLIPRPETENLVSTAIEWCQYRTQKGAGIIKAVDVGTGSGCIAISIAAHEPQTNWSACDVSRSALEIARRNAHNHLVDNRIDFLETDLLTSFGERSFDLVCANLPYIPTKILADLAVFEHEPTLALDGGSDGLVLIRPLLEQSRSHLSPSGLLLAEIEASQGQVVLEIANQVFPDAKIDLQKDLAGHNRLLELRT